MNDGQIPIFYEEDRFTSNSTNTYCVRKEKKKILEDKQTVTNLQMTTYWLSTCELVK